MNNYAGLRKLFLVLIVCCSLVLCGCANDDYAIEKKYWRLKKQTDKILKNPHATPPNELQKAVLALNAFNAQYPKNELGMAAEFSIANLYLAKENYEACREQLRMLLKKYKESKEVSAQIIFLIGNSYELQEKWPTALEQYKNIMQNYAETIKGLEMPLYIARHYKAKYEPDKMNAALQEAIGYYKAIGAKHPVTPLSLNMDMLAVQCHLEMKDWQGAVNELNAALKTYNGKIKLDEILLALANIYGQKMNNPEKATEILNILLKEYPKSKYANLAKDMVKRLSAKSTK